jgi:DNA-directed RNA polymerase subunit omega
VRDEYLKSAQETIGDPKILVNLLSQRVRQFRFGARPLIDTLERLDPEDIALREIIAGKISYELFNDEKDKNEENTSSDSFLFDISSEFK